MTNLIDDVRPKSGSERKAPFRRTGVFSVVRHAVVATASCALLLGAAAAGQAGGETVMRASVVQSLMPEPAATADSDELPVPAATEGANTEASPTSEATPAAPAAPAPAAAPSPAEPAPAPAPAEPAPAPAAVVPAPEPVAVNDPAGAQAYAQSQLGSYGWDVSQMSCLTTLWIKESDWITTATNPSSGAYGIVQSLPAEKMASAGPDYRTNYRTQINWGLNYIQERYQSPCGALNFHLANNWY